MLFEMCGAFGVVLLCNVGEHGEDFVADGASGLCIPFLKTLEVVHTVTVFRLCIE